MQILELKVAKYERMKEEKKGKRKSMGTSDPHPLGDESRKDSTLMVMERINGTRYLISSLFCFVSSLMSHFSFLHLLFIRSNR